MNIRYCHDGVWKSTEPKASDSKVDLSRRILNFILLVDLEPHSFCVPFVSKCKQGDPMTSALAGVSDPASVVYAGGDNLDCGSMTIFRWLPCIECKTIKVAIRIINVPIVTPSQYGQLKKQRYSAEMRSLLMSMLAESLFNSIIPG